MAAFLNFKNPALGIRRPSVRILLPPRKISLLIYKLLISPKLDYTACNQLKIELGFI
jgi:hypothetical protein